MLVFDRLRNAEEGVLPRKPKIGRKTGITNEDINEAIHSLEKLQKMEMKKNKKKQKKKKSNQLLFITWCRVFEWNDAMQ